MAVLSLSSMANRPAIGWRRALAGLLAAWPYALIGIELAALVALWPETLRAWWQADDTGDFRSFLSFARDLELNGMYSPALSLFLHPLTYLSIENAYRVYVGLGMLALLAVAYLAQRGVATPQGKAAIALGILALPQMHWALRLGHVTAFLCLAALAGFLLLKPRPLLAGLCFSLLVLKPQYAPVPALYLLWTRNGRALAGLVAGAVVLELVGFAAVGFGSIGPYLSSILDWAPDSRDNLLPVQQAWQYSWPGFLISAGLDANPLVVFDLALLSLGAVVVVWLRAERSLALAAAALGMLLVTPYSNFYDWGLVAVAAALLLRADVRWRWAPPLIAAGLYLALLASQAVTPWPAVNIQADMVGTQGHFLIAPTVTSSADGLYWITPAALATICFLALARRRGSGAGQPEEPAPQPPPIVRDHARPLGASLALAGGCVALVYFAAAFVGHVPPFTQHHDAFSQQAVLAEVPQGFPLPPDGKVAGAGKGGQLPYHVEWTSAEPVSEVAGIYRRILDGVHWELMLDESTGPSYRVRISRLSPGGFLTHWAMLDVSPEGLGSRVTLDFIVTQRIDIASGS